MARVRKVLEASVAQRRERRESMSDLEEEGRKGEE